jgi:hypothetical protein
VSFKRDSLAALLDRAYANYTSLFRPLFIGSPATFSVLRVTALQENFREIVWTLIRDEYPLKRLSAIHCGLDRLVYFPAYKLQDFILARMRESSLGFFRLGAGRLFPSPSYKIKPIVLARLRESSLGFAGFGVNRLVYSPVPAFRRIVAESIRRASFGLAQCGLNRLMYTAVYEIRGTVYKDLRTASAGFVRYRVSRILPFHWAKYGICFGGVSSPPVSVPCASAFRGSRSIPGNNSVCYALVRSGLGGNALFIIIGRYIFIP